MAARVSSSAVSNPPTRGIEQIQSLCSAVYEILEIKPPAAGNDRLWFDRLDAVVALPENSPERRAAEDQLVDAMLGNSAPDQLATEILARVHLGAKFAYQTAPDWTHGTVVQRFDLERRLWLRAKEFRARTPSADDRAVAYGRAAVLLSAQETFFGIAPLHGVYNDPEFDSLTRLDPRQAIQLRRHVEDHRALSNNAGRHLVLADKAITELRAMTSAATTAPTTVPATTIDPADAERRVIESIDAMIAMAEGRPDLQWLAASTAAQLFALRPSPSGLPSSAWANTWAVRLPKDPHFARWMSEAAANPTRVKGPRKLAPGEVLKKIH
jgi:hypothetical protein